MKTILKLFIVANCIFQPCYSNAQQIEMNSKDILKLQKTKLNNSTFIFEGVVTNQQCYHSAHGIATCSVVQITKIFKGSEQIKLGTIKIVTLQGGKITDNQGNITEIAGMPSDDTRPMITKGMTYIIFGNLADSSLWGSSESPALTIKTDNNQIILSDDRIGLDLKNHNKNPKIYPDVTSWWGTHFKSLDSLYSFLKENGNLIIQEEVSDSNHEK